MYYTSISSLRILFLPVQIELIEFANAVSNLALDYPQYVAAHPTSLYTCLFMLRTRDTGRTLRNAASQSLNITLPELFTAAATSRRVNSIRSTSQVDCNDGIQPRADRGKHFCATTDFGDFLPPNVCMQICSGSVSGIMVS